jgi:S-adenosylmethionine decarboxylase
MTKIQEREVRLELPKVIGKHVYGNLNEVNPKVIADLNYLIKTVVESSKVGNLHIIEMITKKFNSYNEYDGGVSIIALIEESHIALHTWPESMYATLDIYSCGEESNPDAAFSYIVNKLKPKSVTSSFIDRSKM